MLLYAGNFVSPISATYELPQDFFGFSTIINKPNQSNQSDSDFLRKIIYCMLCLNKFIWFNFDGTCVRDVVMYIVSIMPYKKIEINAKNHYGVVIRSETLFRTSIYVSGTPYELSHGKWNLRKLVDSNIRSLLSDKDYLMMLTIDTQLIVKRRNCEQEVILSGVKSISQSKFFVFAILTNCNLYGWERDLFRKSNSKRSVIPKKINLPNVMMIKFSAIYMCAITNNFELYTWKALGTPQKHPLSKNLTDIVSADGGEEHICVLSKRGEIYTWGSNVYGQLGLYDLKPRSSPEKIKLTDIVSVGCGKYYSMALTQFGDVYMWGYKIGQSKGHPYGLNLPYKLYLSNVVNISCGDEYAMALTTENVVHMWGDSVYKRAEILYEF